MSEQNKITARVSLSIYFDCPRCGVEYEDLMDVDYLNDEGQLWTLVGSNNWREIDTEFDCPKCKQTLILDKLEY
jgi:rubredoxin